MKTQFYKSIPLLQFCRCAYLIWRGWVPGCSLPLLLGPLPRPRPPPGALPLLPPLFAAGSAATCSGSSPSSSLAELLSSLSELDWLLPDSFSSSSDSELESSSSSSLPELVSEESESVSLVYSLTGCPLSKDDLCVANSLTSDILDSSVLAALNTSRSFCPPKAVLLPRPRPLPLP